MYIFYFILAAVLFFFDYITKFLAFKYLKGQSYIEFIKNILNLSYIENRGAAFGILQNQKIFFAIVTFISLVAIAYYFFSLQNTKIDNIAKLSLVFIFSGALGNFIDRIFRGYVIDFIELAFFDFPVFNLADIFLTIGFIIFGFILLFLKN